MDCLQSVSHLKPSKGHTNNLDLFKFRTLIEDDVTNGVHKDIVGLWKETLLSVQKNKRSTKIYITRALQGDMKNIYKNYKEFILCFKEKELVGFAGLTISTNSKYGTECNLQRIVVKNKYRKIGIATKLSQKLIEKSKEYCKVVFATVDINNNPSYMLLTKLGFNKNTMLNRNIMLMSLKHDK